MDILKEWINKKEIDVVITTGGTGLTGRDITPEAIEEIADKQIPGFGEIFRNISLKTVGTSAIQSRACAVLANGKYIFALPGSSGGVTDAWDEILIHQLDINHKPCNFVEFSGFPQCRAQRDYVTAPAPKVRQQVRSRRHVVIESIAFNTLRSSPGF